MELLSVYIFKSTEYDILYVFFPDNTLYAAMTRVHQGPKAVQWFYKGIDRRERLNMHFEALPHGTVTTFAALSFALQQRVMELVLDRPEEELRKTQP